MSYVWLFWMVYFPFPVLKSAHGAHWSKDKLPWLIAGRKCWHTGISVCARVCVFVCECERARQREKESTSVEGVLVWWSHTGNQWCIERRKMPCPGVAAHNPAHKRANIPNNRPKGDVLRAEKTKGGPWKMTWWYLKFKHNANERERPRVCLCACVWALFSRHPHINTENGPSHQSFSWSPLPPHQLLIKPWSGLITKDYSAVYSDQ